MQVSNVWRRASARCAGVVLRSLAATIVMVSTAMAAVAPRVVFTDVPSGPVSGGEGNQGAYLSIFGRNFGSPDGLGTRTKVTIGGVEVANYRSLGPSQVADRLGLQQLTVQVGALTGKAAGQAWPVRVLVDGVASNVDVTFTPNPGRVLFVALNGNDATAAANDINHPWRHLQDAAGGAYGALRAGDQVVLRGGTWQDTLGIDGTWLRFGNDPSKKGSAPTGAVGTGWIHITRYPGPIGANAPEDVHYVTPANQRGGIQGPWSAIRGVSGEYIAISNLRIEVDATAKSDAAPINTQYSAGPWQITNNELGPWPSTLAAPGNAKAAGISGEGNGVVIRGNHIHDIACAKGRPTNPLENHGIYIDDDGRYDIGFNVFERITGGNGLQIYTNGGFSKTTNNVSFHHNIVDGVGKHGINLADGSGRNIKVFDNLVLNTQFSGLRMNSVDLIGAQVYNNTFYNTSLHGPSDYYGAVSNEWNLKAGSVDFANNIFWPSAGSGYTGGTVPFTGKEGSWAHNLWFGGADEVPAFAQAPVTLDPKFVSAGSDFHLRAGSPAINAGSAAVSPTVVDDLDGRRRPKAGGYDIGTYEAPSAAR